MAVIYDKEDMKRGKKDLKAMKFLGKVGAMLQDYYAERLSMFYVLGANWFYKMCYAIIKPFLA